VATVNGKTIDRLSVLKELTWAAVARNHDRAARKQMAEQILDSLIASELMVQAAEAEGVTVPDEDIDRALTHAASGYPKGAFERMLHAEQMTADSYKRRLQRELLIERFLAEKTAAVREVSEQELRALYQAKVLPKPRPPQVLARQVLVKTEEEAEHILGELKARRLTVEQAARRYSAAPEGQDGGLLPWFARGELPEVFDHCFSLEEGQASEVVPSNYGFHVFELVAKRPAGPPSFESERARLERDVRRGKEKRAIESLVTTLKTGANITIDRVALGHVVDSLPPPPVDSETGPDPVLLQQNSDTNAKFQVKNKPVPRYKPRQKAAPTEEAAP
jgi:peptidyl-prolyl cis-trans isomerase C